VVKFEGEKKKFGENKENIVIGWEREKKEITGSGSKNKTTTKKGAQLLCGRIFEVVIQRQPQK